MQMMQTMQILHLKPLWEKRRYEITFFQLRGSIEACGCYFEWSAITETMQTVLSALFRVK